VALLCLVTYVVKTVFIPTVSAISFKRRTLLLSSGKQIKLFGSSIAIGKSLEIGEGYAPNIFSCSINPAEPKSPPVVANPNSFTGEEIMELADYNIQLWMDLKENIRKHGMDNSKIFNQEALR
jgi:hypothetical protein